MQRGPEQELISFKKNRRISTKASLSVTVDSNNIDKLFGSFGAKFPSFFMMSKSEQIDFLLIYLKKFVDSSPSFSGNMNPSEPVSQNPQDWIDAQAQNPMMSQNMEPQTPFNG